MNWNASNIRIYRHALSSIQDWVGFTAEKLIADEPLSTSDLCQIVKRALDVLTNEPSLLKLKQAECKVVGQLAGNVESLLAIFRQFGWPSTQIYVFLGNYICLGRDGSVQVGLLLLLLLFKSVYPSNIFLLRGDNECEHCAAELGLVDVCNEQFCSSMYIDLVHVFKYLPLAAVVGNAYFLSCSSLSLSRVCLTDFEVVARPGTTCSKIDDRLSYLTDQLSEETFQHWNRERGDKNRNLRLFLKWNRLTAVVKSHEEDPGVQQQQQQQQQQRRCPVVEGPGSTMISFHSSAADGGVVMAIHQNLLCSFHSVRPAAGQPLVKMLVPDRSSNLEEEI